MSTSQNQTVPHIPTMKTHSFSDSDEGSNDTTTSILGDTSGALKELKITNKNLQLMQNHHELRKDISQCNTMMELLCLYDQMDAIARPIRVAMGNRSSDEWAADWAIAFRLKPNDSELVSLNEHRKTILAFIYRLVDCIWDETCNDVTIQSVEKDFKPHRLMNLLQLVVPMDRAQCLYKMQYISMADKKNCCGMHWVAKAHVNSSTTWSTVLHEVQGRPTINKRLMFLHEQVSDLETSRALTRWLSPQLALWW